jgi:hypothetical protein
VRSRPPVNFFLHTQEGDGNATDLSRRSFAAHPVQALSHTITPATKTRTITASPSLTSSTPTASWSVLSANVEVDQPVLRRVNAHGHATSGSSSPRRLTSRPIWRCRTARSTASHRGQPAAVQAARQGISDHQYVTTGSEGRHPHRRRPNFPWDVFTRAAVNKYAKTTNGTPEAPPVTSPSPLAPDRDQLTMRWNCSSAVRPSSRLSHRSATRCAARRCGKTGAK